MAASAPATLEIEKGISRLFDVNHLQRVSAKYLVVSGPSFGARDAMYRPVFLLKDW
jgi:hypothetical protein